MNEDNILIKVTVRNSGQSQDEMKDDKSDIG